MTFNRPAIPPDYHNDVEHRRMLANGVNWLLEGKINALGTFTLTQSNTTTTVTDARIGADSVLLWMPTTANAATAMTSLYVSARADGSATLTHNNTADSDRTFSYAVFG